MKNNLFNTLNIIKHKQKNDNEEEFFWVVIAIVIKVINLDTIIDTSRVI